MAHPPRPSRGTRADGDIDGLVRGDPQEKMRHLCGPYLRHDLDHAEGMVAEEDLRLREHIDHGQRPQTPREHRTDARSRSVSAARMRSSGSSALGVERTAREAGGEAQLCILVTREGAKGALDLHLTDLGE